MRPNTKADFMERVGPGGPDDCWLWTGYVASNGYGEMSYLGENWSAHRLGYLFEHGTVPRQVNHHCDVALCVNPRHLYAGTQRENMGDRLRRGRWKGGRPSKTDPKIVRAIRSAPAYRGLFADLAREHGVSESFVRGIRSGKYLSEVR